MRLCRAQLLISAICVTLEISKDQVQGQFHPDSFAMTFCLLFCN